MTSYASLSLWMSTAVVYSILWEMGIVLEFIDLLVLLVTYLRVFDPIKRAFGEKYRKVTPTHKRGQRCRARAREAGLLRHRHKCLGAKNSCYHSVLSLELFLLKLFVSAGAWKEGGWQLEEEGEGTRCEQDFSSLFV